MGQLNLKDPLTLTHAHTPKKKKKRTSDEGEADKHQSLLQQLENPSVNFGSSRAHASDFTPSRLQLQFSKVQVSKLFS